MVDFGIIRKLGMSKQSNLSLFALLITVLNWWVARRVKLSHLGNERSMLTGAWRFFLSFFLFFFNILTIIISLFIHSSTILETKNTLAGTFHALT